jgi:hypothetical protein
MTPCDPLKHEWDWSKWNIEFICRCKKCGEVFECIHDWDNTGDPKIGYKCKKCLRETGGYMYYCDICEMWCDVFETHLH